MPTLSVPLVPRLEEAVNNLVKSGFVATKADVVRKAIARLVEDEAVMAVLKAEQEIAEGKGLSKQKFAQDIRKEGVVVLPIKVYRQLLESVIPTEYLKGAEAKQTDRLVEDGLQDYYSGKCETIKSLADLD